MWTQSIQVNPKLSKKWGKEDQAVFSDWSYWWATIWTQLPRTPHTDMYSFLHLLAFLTWPNLFCTCFFLCHEEGDENLLHHQVEVNWNTYLLLGRGQDAAGGTFFIQAKSSAETQPCQHSGDFTKLRSYAIVVYIQYQTYRVGYAGPRASTAVTQPYPLLCSIVLSFSKNCSGAHAVLYTDTTAASTAKLFNC